MGASREVFFSALAEPALLLGLAALAAQSHSLSLTDDVRGVTLGRAGRPRPGRRCCWWPRRCWSCSSPRTPAFPSTTRTRTWN